MVKIVSVKPLVDTKLLIFFADGTSGIFDVAPYIRGEFFQRLANYSYFRLVGVFFTGIGWPDGQDLGPDTIAADLLPLPPPV